MTPHKTLLEAAGAPRYSKGVVLRSLYPQSLPEQVERGDVAIIEKVNTYQVRRPPAQSLSVTYDLLLLRTREVARDVPAYQIAVYWSVVPSQEQGTS